MNYQIRETKMYDKFTFHILNRDINPAKLKKLKASMRKHGWIPAYPIHTYIDNGRLIIKDGHHRYIAAKELGIEIKYVICSDNATLYEINDPACEWKLKDYFKSYCRDDNDEYNFVKQYSDDTGISLRSSIQLLRNQVAGYCSNFDQKIKSGTFKVSENTEYAGTIGHMVKTLKKKGVDFAASNAFVYSLSKVMFVDEFDWTVFLTQSKKNKTLLKKQNTAEEYLLMIEKVYNSGNKKQIPLAFLTKQKMSERKLIKRKEI